MKKNLPTLVVMALCLIAQFNIGFAQSQSKITNGPSCGEKDYDCRIAAATKAIQANPNDAAAYSKRGDAYKALGDLERSKLDYGKAIELRLLSSGNDDVGQKLVSHAAEDHVRQGVVYYNNKQYSKALDEFTKAIELDPQNYSAYGNRGNVYSEQQIYYSAIEDYTKAIDLNPKYEDAYYSRGSIYLNKCFSDLLTLDCNKARDLAFNDLTKAIELNPRNYEAYYDRGNIYNKRYEYAPAIADYNKAIEISPQYYPAYGNRGIAYKKLGKYDLAIADFNKAISLKPTDSVDYARRAFTYCAQGKKDLAIADEIKTIELGGKLIKKCE